MTNPIKKFVQRSAAAAGYKLVPDNDFAITWQFDHMATKRALRATQPTVVLDVGGNSGQFYHGLRELGYDGPVITFEPIPELVEQMKAAADSNWHVFGCALGASRGTGEFNVMAGTDFSSFLEPTRSEDGLAGNKVERKIMVEIETLDALSTRLGEIADCSRIFLKMDTQGFDLEVFAGAGSLLPNIVGIMTELPVQEIYDGMPSMLECLSTYKAAGFVPTHFSPVSIEDSQAVEFDCILVRE